MTEPTDERIPVRYFCTAGNGMEYFVVDEVYRKLAAENVSGPRNTKLDAAEREAKLV